MIIMSMFALMLILTFVFHSMFVTPTLFADCQTSLKFLECNFIVLYYIFYNIGVKLVIILHSFYLRAETNGFKKTSGSLHTL